MVLHLVSKLIPNISYYFNRVWVTSLHAYTKRHILILNTSFWKNRSGWRKRAGTAPLICLHLQTYEHISSCQTTLSKRLLHRVHYHSQAHSYGFSLISHVPTSLASDMPHSLSLPLLANTFFFQLPSLSFV